MPSNPPDPAGNIGASSGSATTAPTRLHRPTLLTVLVVLVLVGGFVALAVAVARHWAPLIELDGSIELAAHFAVLTHQALRVTALTVTALGSPVAMDLVTAAAAAALLLGRQLRAAVFVVAARLLELGIETGVKDLLARPRPVLADPVDQASGYSFPSGHSAGTAVVCAALLVILLRARHPDPARSPRGRSIRAATVGTVAIRSAVVVGALLLLTVPASRVLLGVHYTSDVTAGVLLGLASALALSPLATWRHQPSSRPPDSPPNN